MQNMLRKGLPKKEVSGVAKFLFQY